MIPKLAQSRFPAHIFAMLPGEQSTPEQIAIYRHVTPERRLSLAEQLYWSAREIKAAWLRAQHADWSEEKIAREVTRAFTNARAWTFAAVHPPAEPAWRPLLRQRERRRNPLQ